MCIFDLMSKITENFDKKEQTNKTRFINLYKFISTFSYDYGIDSLTLLCATLLELLLLWPEAMVSCSQGRKKRFQRELRW